MTSRIVVFVSSLLSILSITFRHIYLDLIHSNNTPSFLSMQFTKALVFSAAAGSAYARAGTGFICSGRCESTGKCCAEILFQCYDGNLAIGKTCEFTVTSSISTYQSSNFTGNAAEWVGHGEYNCTKGADTAFCSIVCIPT